jgi:hypothetical protein
LNDVVEVEAASTCTTCAKWRDLSRQKEMTTTIGSFANQAHISKPDIQTAH